MNYLGNFRDWKTTVIGVVTAILMVLVVTGQITAEQQATILEWISQLVGIVAGIILMFFSKYSNGKE